MEINADYYNGTMGARAVWYGIGGIEYEHACVRWIVGFVTVKLIHSIEGTGVR